MDIGAVIAVAGLTLAYRWLWTSAPKKESIGEQPGPSSAQRGPSAGPAAAKPTPPVPTGRLKGLAMRACRLAGSDYADEFPRQVDALIAKVAAWEAVQGPAVREGWVVYGQLGALRKLVGEPLLRDPEAAVLLAVTCANDPVWSPEAVI